MELLQNLSKKEYLAKVNSKKKNNQKTEFCKLQNFECETEGSTMDLFTKFSLSQRRSI